MHLKHKVIPHEMLGKPWHMIIRAALFNINYSLM